jgi:hypothetical protein
MHCINRIVVFSLVSVLVSAGATAGEVEWNVTDFSSQKVDQKLFEAFLSVCEMVFEGEIVELELYEDEVGPHTHGFANIRFHADEIYIGDSDKSEINLKMNYVGIPGVVSYIGRSNAEPEVGKKYFVLARRLREESNDLWVIPGGLLENSWDGYRYGDERVDLTVDDIVEAATRFSDRYSREGTFESAEVIVVGTIVEFDARSQGGVQADIKRALKGVGPSGMVGLVWDRESRVVRGPTPSPAQRQREFLFALERRAGEWIVLNNTYGIAIFALGREDRAVSVGGVPVSIEGVY